MLVVDKLINSNLTEYLELSILLKLMIVVVIITFRTIIAIIVDNCLISVIRNKGYVISSDKKTYRNSSLMTFLFIIITGLFIGTIIAIGYVGVLPIKEKATESKNE